ncbi:DUF4329 domain-containing protein, partial [Clostridia bacterium OttesenSCG-928-F22]|nr:DUF4329 domain-containing protein [Clostridia bacterium OttesenSCG-928-F22]
YCLNTPVNMADTTGQKPGDLFDTMDQAAKDAGLYIQQFSFMNGWEYATAIYKETVEEVRWVLMETTWGFCFTYHSFTVKVEKYTYKIIETDAKGASVRVPNAPKGKKRVAVVHTHPFIPTYIGHEFSPADKRVKVPNYLYTPYGTMRRYDPATGEDVELFTGLPRDPKVTEFERYYNW